MTDEEYGEMLRSSGYGVAFVQREVAALQRYREQVVPVPDAVTEGPHVTEQYRAWTRRRKRQATEGGEHGEKQPL